jgi:regulator of protease activity HflC (stomatin/prohibitin superfamily)
MSDTAAPRSWNGQQIADAVMSVLKDSGLRSLYGNGQLRLTPAERAELAADVLEHLAERVAA